MRWIAVNYLFSPRSQYSSKRAVPTPVRTSALLHAFYCLVHCANCHLCLRNSMWIYSDWVNFGNHMRWIFVRNAVNFAVNFCKKCGDMWWIIFFHRIHRFHRISYIILPQKSMQWIFVRNAVNFAVKFCKKCGEMRWNIYFHRIHRNQRISYKNSPHSPHFLQKFTQKPRSG